MSPGPQVRFCPAHDGVRLAFASTGRGPPLLKAAHWLSHLEWDAASPLWRHWLAGLSRRHTFVRYDARGCGLSDRDPPEISSEALVRDLEAVVDALRLERFALLGISFGAATAIAYAVRHPERVSHLVLYGGFARGRLVRGGGQAAIEELALTRNLVQMGWAVPGSAYRKVFAAQLIPDAGAELAAELDELQPRSSSVGDALRFLDMMSQVEVSELARRVACPTLVLHATRDGRVPFEEGRLLAGLIEGSRFVPLESRNHVLLPGEPAWQRFLEEIDSFLPGAADAFPALTAREREVVEHLARGLDNHQIAARLEISEKTVRNVLTVVLDKLGVESRSAAIVRAREAGYGVHELR